MPARPDVELRTHYAKCAQVDGSDNGATGCGKGDNVAAFKFFGFCRHSPKFIAEMLPNFVIEQSNPLCMCIETLQQLLDSQYCEKYCIRCSILRYSVILRYLIIFNIFAVLDLIRYIEVYCHWQQIAFDSCLFSLLFHPFQKNDGFRSAGLLPAQHTVHQHVSQHQV